MKEAKEFAESIAAIFIETSARNAVNVEELFQKISRCSRLYCVMCIYLVWELKIKVRCAHRKAEKPHCRGC